MMDCQFPKITKSRFPAVSLPGLRLSPRAHPNPMIRRGFCFGLPLEKIFTLSFPVRQGNRFAGALPAWEALSRRSVTAAPTLSREPRRKARCAFRKISSGGNMATFIARMRQSWKEELR
jgi:hypothetical protein